MRTSMYGSSLNISWIYLGNDGVIVVDPVAGANPIDLTKEEAKNASNTGTYTKQGDKLIIKWSYGKKAEWRVDKEGNKIKVLDGDIVTQPVPMPANYKLEGSYSASEVVPNASSVNTFHFKNDSTLELRRSGAVDTPGSSATPKDQRTRKYSITGNTLTLKMASGTMEK